MPKWTAAVDLTSRDLRTGAIQLPGRLADLPPAGELAAVDAADGTPYALQLAAPRELRGLGPYFEVHALRTNDAISLVFEAGELTLDAIRRQRRHAGRNPAARTAPEQEPAPAEPQAAEPVVPVPAAQEPAVAEPTEMEMPLTEDATPAGELEQPAASLQAAAGQADPPSATASPADPFAGFSTADTFEPFDDELDIRSLGSTRDDPEMDDPAPEAVAPAPAVVPEHTRADSSPAPVDDAGEAATLPEVTVTPGSPTAVYHTLPQRRPFRAHSAQSLPQNVVLPSVVEHALNRLSAAGEPEVRQPEDSVPDLAEDHAPVEAAGTGSENQPLESVAASLEGYLSRPDLPAIIRISLLAAELRVDEEELAQAVTAYTQQADAQLTYVRPDYYLFKRPRG